MHSLEGSWDCSYLTCFTTGNIDEIFSDRAEKNKDDLKGCQPDCCFGLCGEW